MALRELGRNVYWVGAIDWDRRLFDELVPLPEGTSYNSYLVIGSEKTALIDAVDPSMEGELLANIAEARAQGLLERIDFIISNHAEQDHSGAVPKVLELFMDCKVLTNPKCRQMLRDLLLIPDERFQDVADGEVVSLGNRSLQFIYAPWVHWPETMFTYLLEDRVLFTCDFLGSHLATSELDGVDEQTVYRSAKRYYAEIMMPFRTSVRSHLGKVEQLQPEMIAPSHGPVHKRPEFILEAYKDWTSDKTKNEVVLVYVSMHGSTREMVKRFVGALVKRGVSVKQFCLSSADTGELAMALVDAATIVIAAPTVLAGAHPLAAYAAYLVNALRPKAKHIAIIGSYGWGGKMVEQLKGLLDNLKVEILEPVLVKGFPKEEDFAALERLAEEISNRHREAL